ncbi:two-component system, OmpR family, response regulator RstA [Pseudoalteromonas rubra]|uniref:Two-component system, OmpR family, response regulator RstA n=1 Tax=Pseudoalteromonas rubra TaxID=43658 RepID=A0A8T0C2H6_9GAMM|nr:response regulator [Pseudoalteromonas rubra]KAF7781441.1 two-component system, OmpR family, response regulator RstA [Pseudoalteromonas rubra]
MTTQQKILLIDDDRELTQLMSQFLQKNGYDVACYEQGNGAVARVDEYAPDLLVLDLMLPGQDGLSICRQIRGRFTGPIIMLTALVDDIDEVTGLEVGADDYLCKPVKPRVLLAHIRAQLRRHNMLVTQTSQTVRTINDGEICIDLAKRKATCGDKEVLLSSAEFELLWLLANSAGRILSRDELYRTIFKLDFDGMDRSIDLRISRLRKKLGDDPKEPKIIKTIRNKGYLIAS